MALSVKVGSFTCPASTGNQATTGVGFQPQAILFWGDGRSSNGADATTGTSTTMSPWYGIATSSSSRAVIWYGDDLQTGSSIAGSDGTKCCKLFNGSTTRFVADFVSFDADGFTVNFTTANATAYVINYLAIGGTDVTNVAIKSLTSPTSTGNQAYTGVGFQPDVLFALGSESDNVHPTQSFSLGWGVSSSSRCAISNGFNGNTLGRYQRSAKVFATCAGNDGVYREADLVSLDSDGFTWNWSTVQSSQQTVYVLCIKGGRWKAAAINQKTSTGTQGYTGVGFTPTGLVLASFGIAAQTTVETTRQVAMVGAASSTSARGVVFYGSGADGVAELNRSEIYTQRADDGTPTLSAAADLSSFDSDGFTLNFTTADATARESIYLAMGNGSTPVTITPGLGSELLTGRAPTIDWSIGMPDQP